MLMQSIIKNKRRAITLGVAAVAFGALCGIATDCTPEISHYTIKTDKISGTVKVAFLSDLHDSLYGENQSQLTDIINNTCKPDIIIFGGDIADEIKGGKPENSYNLVSQLVQSYPCFYSPGNHEYERFDCDVILQAMSDLGVTVLVGDSRYIEINDCRLYIAGIYSPDMTVTTSTGEILYQLEAVCNEDSDTFKLLLCHFPEDIEKIRDMGAYYGEKAQFDIVLSGHAHGGQWRLPFCNDGLYAPGQGLFPEYTNGMYEFGNTTLLVSRGLWKPHIQMPIPRIFNKPDIVMLEISGN